MALARKLMILGAIFFCFYCSVNWPDDSLIARYFRASQLTSNILGMLLLLVSAGLMLDLCLRDNIVVDRVQTLLFLFALGIELIAPQNLANNLAFVAILFLLFGRRWLVPLSKIHPTHADDIPV